MVMMVMMMVAIGDDDDGDQARTGPGWRGGIPPRANPVMGQVGHYD